MIQKKTNNFYRGRDCIKSFCSDLKELVIKIINYKLIPLTDNKNKFYEEKKSVAYAKKSFVMIKMKKKKFKLYQKVRDHCHYTGKFRGAAHSICNLNYKVPQEIPVKIHNGSKYDYHFLIKELAEEFKGEFECLRENTEKYISFSVILVDSCEVNYQTLLITCLKLIMKIAKHARREKISNQNVSLLGLKIID